ncbi:hypothetical protein BEI02_12950 [Elizabethkingia sp. HvH-WGS333]|uniref:hypothetical protein n=1 Tax=Elizabethkingia TaxID=308865 RepID=UPI000741D080|nr:MULTISPECIES: hypothetical protein [Elizabethkingia]KUG12709.1 hypothetical protein AMC91_05650 [Elizabethkingia miricola]MCL1656681.1 hypothetical protein [Elizabethkingia miricola]MCP1252503.1 hypothetical protein [Elizabethkingia sp. S0634]OIK46887.1 hypothetical protein BEI02_12950 [Elizabethkingia sp. HvH-WGS333]
MKTLKYLIVLSILILSSELIKAQNYNPIINYSFNDTPVHGVKIKTNIPFINQQGMPTIIIEGYNYFDGKPIGLIFNWYIYENEFINNSISSFGAYTPEVKLSNENGKVVIFINDKKYFNRFMVRGFASGMHEDISWFSGWSIADEPLSGAKAITIPYKNTIGELNFPTGIITNNGNVGIGTTNPENIEGWNKVMEIKGTTDSKLITSTTDVTTGIWSHNYGFFSAPTGGIAGTHSNHPYSLITNKIARMTIASDGNIGIGTIKPQNKLDVNGTVHSKEVKVDMAGWADFVFQKDYRLPTLEEVEQHINEKGYLPNVPNTKEVIENGLLLGENQKLLLQKIEELTLYSIEQNKQNKELFHLVEKQQEQIKNLEKNIQQSTNTK